MALRGLVHDRIAKKYFAVEALPYWVYGALVVAYLYADLLVFHGTLGLDNDVYIRAAQIVEWLSGAGWFDTTLHRFAPQEVAVYSRLVDVPYALVALLFRPFLDVHAAVTVAVALVPPLVFLPLYIGLSVWIARPVVGDRWSCIAPIPAVFYSYTLRLFQPGECDHHNIQILLSMAALGFALRALSEASLLRVRKLAVLFALCVATSFQIGMETMPFMFFTIIFFAGCTVHFPDRAKFSFLAWVAVVLPLAEGALLVGTVAPEHYFDSVLYRMSWLVVLLAGAAGLGSASVPLVCQKVASPPARWIALCSIGICLLLALFGIEPNLTDLLWVGVDPQGRVWLTDHVLEMQSGLHLFKTIFLPTLCQTTIAVLGFFMILSAKKYVKERDLFFYQTSFLFLGCVLFFVGEVFVAIRLNRFETPFLILGSLLFAKTFCEAGAKLPSVRSYYGLKTLVFLMIGPLLGGPMVGSFWEGHLRERLFFFVDEYSQNGTIKGDFGITNIAFFMRNEHKDEPSTRVMMALSGTAEALFRTRLTVIGGDELYMGYAGYAVNKAFYEACALDDAARLLRDNNVDYVVHYKGEFTKAFNEKHRYMPVFLEECSTGTEKHEPTLLARIEAGKIPSFLEKIDLPFATYELYQVKKEALPQLP